MASTLLSLTRGVMHGEALQSSFNEIFAAGLKYTPYLITGKAAC